MNTTNKAILFVAHEFGYFKGCGGIAVYLQQIVSYLLNNTDYKVHVATFAYNKTSTLLEDNKLTIHKLNPSNIAKARQRVTEIAYKVNPFYIECADYSALGLDLSFNISPNWIFVTNLHTGTQECVEWGNERSIDKAPDSVKYSVYEEKLQIENSDYVFSPSVFLMNYVKKRYNIKNKNFFVFPNPYTEEINKKDMSEFVNLDKYNDSFNISLISRFEGRKKQLSLLHAFLAFNKTNSNSKLFMAGSDLLYSINKTYKTIVLENIPKNKQKDIKIFDFFNADQKQALLQITDVTVMSSTFENQPLAMIEACLLGVPIIASKYTGCSDYIKNNNMLFDPFVEGSLLNSLIYFYSLTKDERLLEAKRQKDCLTRLIDPNVSILPRFKLKKKDKFLQGLLYEE